MIEDGVIIWDTLKKATPAQMIRAFGMIISIWILIHVDYE